jgi:hypothetical protein
MHLFSLEKLLYAFLTLIKYMSIKHGVKYDWVIKCEQIDK